MNSRLFAVLVGLLLLVLGGIAVSLLVESGGRVPDTPQVPVGDEPAEAPRDVEPPVVTPRTAPVEPVRETAPTSTTPASGDFSPLGTLIVTGTVRSRSDSRPIAGADVEIYDDESEELESTVTDEAGRYRLEVAGGLPPTFEVKAAADGFSAARAVGSTGALEVMNVTLDIELGPTYTIEGHVVDAVTGAPVDECDVMVRSLDKSFNDYWDSATTDASGFYRIGPIENLPREGIDVFVEPLDHTPSLRTGLQLESGESKITVDFRLYPELVIHGKVATPDGRPIEEATIAAVSRDPEFNELGEEEITDEDGSFELALSSTPFEGLYVLIYDVDHTGVLIDPLPQPDASGRIDLGLVNLEPPVTLRGTVVNARTGARVAGGDVTVFSSIFRERHESDYTDSEEIEDGRFEVRLEHTPVGEAVVRIEAEGCDPYEQTLEIVRNSAELELSVEVEPTVVLDGYVTRVVDRTPVIGARVVVLTPSGVRVHARSRADGYYKLELPPGTRFDQTHITVALGAMTFKMGSVPQPPPGGFTVQQNLAIDVEPVKK
jgi:hypothetical protein